MERGSATERSSTGVSSGAAPRTPRPTRSGPRLYQHHRDRGTNVDSDEGDAREAQRREGAIQVVCLSAERVVHIEGPVRFPVAEQIDCVRGVSLGRERRSYPAPEEAGRPKAVDQHDLVSAVPIALDVHGAGSGRNPKYVGLDGSLGCLEERAIASRG